MRYSLHKALLQIVAACKIYIQSRMSWGGVLVVRMPEYIGQSRMTVTFQSASLTNLAALSLR